MPHSQLEGATTLELLIELMYAGKAQGIVPDLQGLEPISVDEIAAILASRHGQHLGAGFDSWNSWFQSSASSGTKEDRETLARLKEFKDKSDPLFKRARKQLD